MSDSPFKYINTPLKEIPPELKSKVMKDVATAKLLMELAKLFSLNTAVVIERTFKKRKK